MSFSNHPLFSSSSNEVVLFTWIGSPSSKKNDKKEDVIDQTRHDIEGVIQFATCMAFNPPAKKYTIIFQCLAQYEEEYKDLFNALHVPVIVQSVENTLEESKNYKYSLLKAYEETIQDLYKTQIVNNNSRTDKIMFKEFCVLWMSAIISHEFGKTCHVMDTNVKPIDKEKPVILPEWKEFFAPVLNEHAYFYECWFLGVPKNSLEIEKALISYLRQWESNDDFYHKTQRDSYNWVNYESGLTSMALKESIGVDKLPHYPWKFPLKGASVPMPSFNLIKHYYGSHKSPRVNADIFILLYQQKDFEHIHVKNFSLDDYREVMKKILISHSLGALDYLFQHFPITLDTLSETDFFEIHMEVLKNNQKKTIHYLKKIDKWDINMIATSDLQKIVHKALENNNKEILEHKSIKLGNNPFFTNQILSDISAPSPEKYHCFYRNLKKLKNNDSNSYDKLLQSLFRFALSIQSLKYVQLLSFEMGQKSLSDENIMLARKNRFYIYSEPEDENEIVVLFFNDALNDALIDACLYSPPGTFYEAKEVLNNVSRAVVQKKLQELKPTIGEIFHILKQAECTTEIDPTCITREKLQELLDDIPLDTLLRELLLLKDKRVNVERPSIILDISSSSLFKRRKSDYSSPLESKDLVMRKTAT